MTRKIYFNANIITVDNKESIKEAMLIENGKIKAVGTNDEVLCLLDDNTEKIDLKGKTILPGFIDTHGHIVATSQVLMIVPLGEATSKEDVIKRLKDYHENTDLPEGAWIIGFGYDNSKFPDGQHPTKFDLDKVTTEVPITISHASGHLAVVNSLGLDLYGYGGTDYVVPEGGVVRTIEGSRESNGILEENAIMDTEKKKVVPSPTFDQVLDSLVKAQKLYASLGITTTQDASVDENNSYNEILMACAKYGKNIIDIVVLSNQF